MKSFMSDVRSIIDAYERDGFALSRGLLSHEQTRALCERLSHAHESAQRSARTKDGVGAAESIASDRALQHALREDASSAAILMQIAASPRVLPLVQQFHARPFVEHTKVLPKLGGAPATPWHQDAAYWHGMDPRLSMLTLWVALGAADTHNGCLRVARVQSGDTLLPHTFIESRKEYVLGDDVARRHFQDHEIVDLEVEQGDAVFFSCRAVHGAHANTSAGSRLAFKLVFQDFAQRAPALPRHPSSMQISIPLDDSPAAGPSGGAAAAPPALTTLVCRARRALGPRSLLRRIRRRLV
jgi:ectoine hydroxylase-related dioxygenase (phytanoyl-CoA dioxygenase family)